MKQKYFINKKSIGWRNVNCPKKIIRLESKNIDDGSEAIREQKAITLIALVITIIILLILAGVVLSAVFGEDGIIKRTSDAREITLIKGAEEKVNSEVLASYDNYGILNLNLLKDNVKKSLGYTIKEKKFPVTVVCDGYPFKVYADGKISETTIKEPSDTDATVYAGLYTDGTDYTLVFSSTEEPNIDDSLTLVEEYGDIGNEHYYMDFIEEYTYVKSGSGKKISYYKYEEIGVFPPWLTEIEHEGDSIYEKGYIDQKGIKKVIIADEIKPNYTSGWFSGLQKLEEITSLCNIDTSNVTDMSSMFLLCNSITALDVSSFDTSNVTDMSEMFSWCYSLADMDVSKFDTSNVTDMSGMFGRCVSLNTLDVSEFDTSNVMDMSHMFFSCNVGSHFDVSGFNTSKVIDMSDMFAACSASSIDVSGFDTSCVTNMSEMFEWCAGLGSLDLSGFDTTSVMDMNSMFEECQTLGVLDVTGFDTSNVIDMSYMFHGCRELADLDVGGFDTSNVTDMSYMFCECRELTDLDVSGFDTSNVTDMRNMFDFCNGLTTLDVTEFDTSNVIDMSGLFGSCEALTTLDVSGFNTSKVINMSEMFCRV